MKIWRGKGGTYHDSEDVVYTQTMMDTYPFKARIAEVTHMVVGLEKRGTLSLRVVERQDTAVAGGAGEDRWPVSLANVSSGQQTLQAAADNGTHIDNSSPAAVNLSISSIS